MGSRGAPRSEAFVKMWYASCILIGTITFLVALGVQGFGGLILDVWSERESLKALNALAGP